ncbi:MAG: membrane dipeptidase [Candidatus Aminicenantes bacterium]|nr:membrane dipeptidase [Candidatus Aminicenantes bacterium]
MHHKVMILCLTISLAFLFVFNSCSSQKKSDFSESEIMKIHQRVLTVDTHSDTPMRMAAGEFDMGEFHGPENQRRGKIDLPRMKQGGLDAEFFAAYVGQGERTEQGFDKARQRADRLIKAVHDMCDRYPDLVGLATEPDDAERLEKQGKIAAFIGMENGYPIGKDLSLVGKFYNKGVRYITLCHSSDNDICDSSTDRREPEDKGLSEFGKKVVAECNRLGIMVDVSHISDQSFFDVMEASRAPVIASHSCVRTLCDHPRNLSDEMLKALAENNGVIQICFVSSFVKKTDPNPERQKAIQELEKKYGEYSEIKDEKVRQKVRDEYMKIMEKYPRPSATVEDMVDHIDYVTELIGVEHVGIGTDFDGGGSLQGCSDVSEMPNVTKELLKRGYSEEEIEKIWGGNVMRVFRKVIELSSQQ